MAEAGEKKLHLNSMTGPQTLQQSALQQTVFTKPNAQATGVQHEWMYNEGIHKNKEISYINI